jgi:hypothetical protein
MGSGLMTALTLRPFFFGALCMGCALISLYFLRYWKNSREPLFAWFSIAFSVMALNWLGLALIDPASESRHNVYLLRLAAFVLIIAGIVAKNRRGGRS